MPHGDDVNEPIVVGYAINHPPITDANTPEVIRALDLRHPGWARFKCKGLDATQDPFSIDGSSASNSLRAERAKTTVYSTTPAAGKFFVKQFFHLRQ